MARLVFAVVALTLFSGASGLNGQFRQQVRDYLGTAGGYLEDRGYAMTTDPYDSSLDDGESEDFWINLDGGDNYAIVGVCDNDCSDIDLEVFDSNGNSLDSDYQVDDAPVLEFTAPRSGRYRIHVYMATCDVNPCYYGVGTYAAGAGGGELNEYERQVQAQLSRVSRDLEGDGYTQTHPTRSGSLDEGDERSFRVNLRTGFTYSIRGQCDADCDDMDLAIYDSNGNEVDSDYMIDDFPILTVRPNMTQEFRVVISMPGCSAEPCYYGVGIWGRREGK